MQYRLVRMAIAFLCITTGAIAASAQITTGVVSGALKDEQGAVVPGATVTLVSETRGTKVADAHTNENGDFVFPNVPGDTYTVEVTLEGFKTLRRAGVLVSPGDRVVVPTMTLTVGGLGETVNVKAEAPMIQAASGERAFTVTTESVENLPIANRNFAGFATLVPGAIAQTGTAIAGGVFRLGGGGQNNIMMDGVSTMDTGNNGQLISMNVDSIAEVKVLTQGYQAEFGRSSGLQISAVTKSGTNQFRGSLYDIERNSDWNSNSWANIKNGDPKPVSKQRDWGYSLGGPIGKPGGANRLFFFYSHEYRPREAGGDINRFRVPTVLERQGDFSQTRDNNGALFNTIRDYTLNLPCTSSDTRGCFQDGGVLGRIPQSRLYPTGMNILRNLWPAPNVEQVPGLGYNYEVQVPVTRSLLHQPVLRADYQVSSTLRFTAKYAGQLQGQDTDPGSLPGFNDLLRWNRNRHAPSITVNYNLSSSMFIEGTYGYSFNEIANLYVSPLSNRANAGLADLPMLFPQAGLVDPSYNAAKVFGAANSPFYTDGRVMYPPNFSWGARVANAPPNLGAQLANINPSHDASFSLTKLLGRHTLKAGAYWNHAYKAQQLGTAGATPFQGALSFANDTQNPLDSGFGYANAALGVLSSYAQQSVVVEGGYIYNNLDWYLQDNWKVNDKLTLDYGHAVRLHAADLRHQDPGLDLLPRSMAGSTGAAALYDGVRGRESLLRHQPSGDGSPQRAAARTDVRRAHRADRAELGQPDERDRARRRRHLQVQLHVAGRRGRAALRARLRHQRHAADGRARRHRAVPRSARRRHHVLAGRESGVLDLAHGAVRAAAGAGIGPGDSRSAAVDVGVAVRGGHSVVHAVERRRADDAAVGVDHRRLVCRAARVQPAARNPRTDTGRHQCRGLRRGIPAAEPGSHARRRAARPARPPIRPTCCGRIRGLGQVGFNFPDFHETYHSIQASLNRRFRDGIAFGLAYTLGLAWEGNIGLVQRLDHNADGTYAIRADQAEYEELNKDMGNRRHLLKANFLWDLPDLHSTNGAMKVVGLAGERLAALRHPDCRIGRPLRHQLLVPERRLECEPDRVAQLPGHDPHRRRYGEGVLGQPVRAVQRRGVRGTADWKPGTGVGPQLHGGLPGSHARPVDRPEHPAGRGAPDSAPPRRVQRAEHRRV